MQAGAQLNRGLATVIEVNIIVSRIYYALKSPRIFKSSYIWLLLPDFQI